MFDFICHPQLMRDILGDYLNFALRKKRFSMQNLYEVKSGRLIKKLEEIVQETQSHINECEVNKIFLFKSIILIKLLYRTALREE